MVRRRVHDESEHLAAELHAADRLLPLDVCQKPPPLVVEAAAPPPVRPLHHVPAALGAPRAHVREHLGVAQAHVLLHGRQQRADGLLPVVYPPRVGEAQFLRVDKKKNPSQAIRARRVNSQTDFLKKKKNPHLSPEGEQRLAGGVHEDELAGAPRPVAVDSEDQVAVRVEDREPAAAEHERFPPHRQHYAASVETPPGDVGEGYGEARRLCGPDGGIWVDLCHRPPANLGVRFTLRRQPASIYIHFNGQKYPFERLLFTLVCGWI